MGVVKACLLLKTKSVAMVRLSASQRPTKSLMQIVARQETNQGVEAQEVVDTTGEVVAVVDVEGEVEAEASPSGNSRPHAVVECKTKKIQMTVKGLEKITPMTVWTAKRAEMMKKTVIERVKTVSVTVRTRRLLAKKSLNVQK
jgi:hypothetical protein